LEEILKHQRFLVIALLAVLLPLLITTTDAMQIKDIHVRWENAIQHREIQKPNADADRLFHVILINKVIGMTNKVGKSFALLSHATPLSEITSFTASWPDGSTTVSLSWQTGSESNIGAFNVWRSTVNLTIDKSEQLIDPNSQAVKVNVFAIAATCSGNTTQNYSFTDTTVDLSVNTYYYYIEAIRCQTSGSGFYGDGQPHNKNGNGLQVQNASGINTPTPFTTNTATSTQAPTSSATRTKTLTPTPSVTPSNTPTSFPSATNTLIPTSTSATATATDTPRPTSTSVPSIGDTYEPDDTCAQAEPISTDGIAQLHTFHQHNDNDWVSFEVNAGVEYLIEARVPPDSQADVVLELFDECSGGPSDSEDPNFSPDIRLTFTAPTDGTYYLHLLNNNPSIYGSQVTYHLSVRALQNNASPGAVILVAGRLKQNDNLQDNIHYLTNYAYRTFLANGYSAQRMRYLATDTTLDADDDGLEDVNYLANRTNLQAAITEWAVDKVGPDQALTLYLMDHGGYDILYLDKPRGEWVQPDELDSWLDQLEQAVPGVKINIIIEACNSGSFIDLSKTVSAPGRVVITSSSPYGLAYASDNGAVFSDALLSSLAQGRSLQAAFQEAQWAAQEAHSDQIPWLDDDGDGLANRSTDGQVAARRGFTFAGTLKKEAWSPYIVQVELSQSEGGRLEVLAEIRDDVQVKDAWAVVYPPSYQPPKSSEELVDEPLPITLHSRGNDSYGGVYGNLTESGIYRVVVYAEDNSSLQGRPKEVSLQSGWQHYLPIIID